MSLTISEHAAKNKTKNRNQTKGVALARICVEDDVESRFEFKKLVRLLNGDDDRALGMLVRFWRIAQKHWGRGRLIPPEELSASELQPILDSGWGVLQPEGVYAIGSERQFAWYHQRVVAATKGGAARTSAIRDKTGQFSVQPESTRTPPEHHPATTPITIIKKKEEEGEEEEELLANARKQNPPDLHVALNPGTQLEMGTGPGTKAATRGRRSRYSEATSEKMRGFFAAYAEGFKAKYGGSPEGLRDPALVGKVGSWIEGVSQARAVSLVQVFTQIDHRQIEDSCHNLWLFFRHLNRIGIALDSGQDPSGMDWSQVFGRPS